VCVCDSIILPISSVARGVPYSTTVEGFYVPSTQLNYSPKRNLKTSNEVPEGKKKYEGDIRG